ncbi:MAG: hypothetical protein JNJ83_06125 [Verrucomicrobiaceae bacterium]|nr:hypothetical protein [Verrucomicrobiaceae bacterium]
MRTSILAPALLLLGLIPPSANAEFKLARLFSDHAVLQSGVDVPVWGWAEAGEQVTVTLGGHTSSATAGKDGRWVLKLPPLKPGGPHVLQAKAGTASLTVSDVLVGEVWLGSGQSNMAMTVGNSKDFEKEQKAAHLPNIRMFTVGGSATKEPQQDCVGSWVVCSPETVGRFSATAYFFGRDIHTALKVPVGLINSSVGGTPIDSWLDADVQRASKELAPMFGNTEPPPDLEALRAKYEKDLAEWKEKAKLAKKNGQTAPRMPRDPVATAQRKGDIGGLFNGKIAPLVPYALKGFLWYQGEANTVFTKAPYYQFQLPLLVQDWRKRWNMPNAPFAWVQLPNFVGRGNGWCIVREAMLKTLTLPNTGMAVTIDVGDPKDIHPKNKQAVGDRLARWALGSAYGQKVATCGPLMKSHEIIGPHVVIKMNHADGGLIGKDGLQGFVICGEDQVWKTATVKIDDSKLFVSSPEVPKPVAVRYAWHETPPVTLWNAAGLPASPFRTDNFPVEPDLEVRKAVAARPKRS